MKHYLKYLVLPIAVLTMAFFISCGDDEEEADVTPDVTPDVEPDTPVCEETDPAIIWFTADDTANQSYSDGQIFWKGSFSWDDETNYITYSGNWAGPYVPLYDDGPAPGGHEPTGQTAGDHIFSAFVYFMADPVNDTEFGYGAENEDYGWIWVGANGSFTVPACSAPTLEADGLVIPEWGDIDFKLEFEATEMATAMAPVYQDDSTLFVKGSFAAWQEFELAPVGTSDTAWEFVWSENATSHYGLLNEGDTVEFIFVIDTPTGTYEGHHEYKTTSQAYIEGVAAYSDYEHVGTSWTEEDIIIAGNGNTAIIIGEDPTE